MFIGNECYIDRKAGLSAIFRRNHCCAVALTLVLELSRHIASNTLTDIRDPLAQLIECELSHADLQAFLVLASVLQLFRLKPKADQNAVHQGRPYMNSLTHVCTFFMSIHCGP